ncbi:hypothetical protein VYF65_001555 [Lysinibacillus irui]|uniref:hypothetical protein n=1 Tax=Lysinibacillus irui TaxID=2998077 RepID=UPI003888727F
MSMVTYIGLNFPVEINDDYTEEDVNITYVFSESEDRQIVKNQHFTTLFVYELETKGDYIWDMHNDKKILSPHNYEKSKRTFLEVCDFLKKVLPKGDYYIFAGTGKGRRIVRKN